MSHWFFKYKIYHLFFWLVYHFGWWSLSTGSPMLALDNILFSPYSTKFLFYVFFQAFGVYLTLYYFMPKYLGKAQYTKFLIAVSLTIVGTAALIITGYYLTAYWSGVSFESLFGDVGFTKLLLTNSLPSTVASMTLALSIKLAKNWISAQKQQQLLEKEKAETELKFLKSQFNPHFLFNTINSIFVLIHKNPGMASDSLATFSDLLRYQLYECNEPKIPLHREMEYLSNFIELGRLRLDREVAVTVHIGDMGNADFEIAPFILMPFLENAFKHVSQLKGHKNWLRIDMKPTAIGFEMNIANSSLPMTNERVLDGPENSGIGLPNVQRRLDLLYPGLHDLKVSQEDGQYRVSLRLQLSSPAETAFEHQALAPVIQPLKTWN